LLNFLQPTVLSLINFYKKNNKKLKFGSLSLEERIFNVTCIISFFTCVFELLFNIFMGTPFGTYLSLFGVIFCIFMYYISAYKRKTVLAIKSLCFASNIAFGVNYFFSSGISGPSFLFFAAVFLMTVAIIPKKDIKGWIAFNIFMFLAVVLTEYFFPQAVVFTYLSVSAKLLNFTVTYLVLIFIIYFAFTYIRRNYEVERFLVVQKNKDIEKQKFDLEKLNAEKDKIFSIVSHDLRAPLHSIQGYLELLVDTQISGEERNSIEGELLRITRDTSNMLTNLLTWAKSQMEGAYAKLDLINVTSVLNSSLSVERDIALKKGVKFEIKADDHLKIIADLNLFQIVVRNLVNNAIKFTPVNGLVSLHATKKNGKCYISVIDNGLGIDIEQQKKLFNLKASSTYGTNNEKGIGLGLLLCKEFVDLQGGEIWFESNIALGSTFFLAFNLAD